MNHDEQVRMADAVEILSGIFASLGFDDYTVSMTSGGIYLAADIAMDDVEAWYDKETGNE